MSVSELLNLRTLDLRNNPKLRGIPKELAHLRSLESILLDESHINYPEPEIISKGTEAIMKFLCSGNGLDITLYRLSYIYMNCFWKS